MGVFLYLDGVKQAAKAMIGDEMVHMGIRPYAMHAGNMLAIVVYPILLCEELERNGKTPKLTFLLSLNDWEQAALTGEDIYKFTFDVQPEHSTLEHSYEDDGRLTVDVWGEEIKKAVQEIKNRYPGVCIKAVRNSELKEHEEMKQVILKTLREKDTLKEVMLSSSGKPTNNSASCFANAICPECKHANTDTIVQNETLVASCRRCKVAYQGQYEEFSYWIYHKPLFAARWMIFGFSHSISGGDHFHEGDVETRKALYEFYFDKTTPKLEMIFSPVLIAENGQKMSKSRRNHHSMRLDQILNLAKNNYSDKIFCHQSSKNSHNDYPVLEDFCPTRT